MPLIPVLPMRDILIYPGVIAPLFVRRERSLSALEDASRATNKHVVVLAQKNVGSEEDPVARDLFTTGTLCQLLQVVRIPDGTTKVLVEGIVRVEVSKFGTRKGYLTAEVDTLESLPFDTMESEPLRRNVVSQFERYVNLHPKLPIELALSLSGVDDSSLLADLVASHLQIKMQERQDLLEMLDSRKRLESVLRILLRETDLLEMERSIHDKVAREMERGHREYYLREQMKAIQEELGIDGHAGSEVEELSTRIKEANMPEEVEKKARTELERFAKMPPMSAESTVVRTYIEWLSDMPWNKRSDDRLGIGVAKEVLDEDHYGLKEVKERILEFLAVRRMAKDTKQRGHVLCFVGPPGVGKTSLGKSIARALDRKFVNISLGGIRDEAEIRGHRRTYIGSLPGRIIQKIRQAETSNPVMLLDEIDKVGTDFRGDPSSALLEVLDPEQNKSFTDHFLDVAFDLSQVMFITTANVTYTIPRPLLDRMEIIHIPGYVAEEKMNIVRRHLWPRILEECGLADINVELSDTAVDKIVREYTREAGVRNLDRQLSKIARKLAMKIVTKQEEAEAAGKKARRLGAIHINESNLKTYLGPPKLHEARLPKEDSIGAALGLAWTESGGDVLVIETAAMSGRGRVAFTGNLGDIMQESAQTALAYLRSTAKKYAIDSVDWDKVDIHVHVPEGAIPKDGPSAGVTLALSMLSVLSGRPIKSTIAMTGEITLRGTVLPIGGVREKILAAKRNGINRVLIPKENKVDVDELADWVKSDMTFTFVSHVKEVFQTALTGKPYVREDLKIKKTPAPAKKKTEEDGA